MLVVFGTSLVNGLKDKELNKRLSNCTGCIKKFPGATVQQMQTYVQPTLEERIPDTVIIHAGCNDL